MKHAEKVLKLASIYDDDNDIYVMPDYSGRGMYGRTVEAIVAPSYIDLMRMFADAIEANIEDPDELEVILESMRSINSQDSMGRNIVFY